MAVDNKKATTAYTREIIPYPKKEECVNNSRLLTGDLQASISPDCLNRPKTEQDDDDKVA